jgi:hypothetical protein
MYVRAVVGTAKKAWLGGVTPTRTAVTPPRKAGSYSRRGITHLRTYVR